MEPVNSRGYDEGYQLEQPTHVNDISPVASNTHYSNGNDNDDNNNGKKGNGSALEKQQTAASNASFDEWYPEGGKEAWLVVAGGWFSLVSSMGILNSLATFQAYWLSHQLSGYSEGTVGWIVSMYTFLTFFCGVYIGPVFDKYGPRYLALTGAACVVLSFLTLSFCKEYWQFMLSFGVLGGGGTSLLLTPSIASVGHWFKKRRGFTTSITTTAGGVGGIIFPLMLTNLWDKIGYGWAVRVLALIALVTGGIGVSLLRSRLPPAQNATAHPDFRIFKQIPFLLATISIFLLEFSLFIPLAYISTYAIHKGFKEEFSYQLLPIMNAGSVTGRLLTGYYADIVGSFNVCMFAVLICLVSCVCVWLPLGHTTAGIVVFAVLFGFGSGTAIAIAPVCIGKMCKTQHYGRYYATAYTVVSIACLIGIPIAGSIVRADNGEYTAVIIFTGVIFLVSACTMMWAKLWHLGWSSWLAVF